MAQFIDRCTSPNGSQTNTNGAIVDYNYDNNGNLYSKLRSEVTETTGEPEGVELTQTSPYAEFYTYNVLGQLVKYTGSESASYTYGADGKRASKTIDGVTTRFLWNGDSLAYESNGTKYYYGNGLTAIAPEGSANKNYYLYDGHGSVTQLTDASGATIADYRYDAFGNQLQAEQPAVYNPFRYSGEYTDAESGLIYLRARYYDPSIGRFISEDPVKDGMNWYVYCANDPVNMIDPMGLKYVALRSIIESLGGSVEWNNSNRTATVYLDGNTAVVQDGSNGSYINGSDWKMYVDDEWLFFALAKVYDLGKGWTGRIERDASGARSDKHVHIYKGNRTYAQNEDGSPHDGSTGTPDGKQKESLKKQSGWDWDAKENDWANKVDISSGVDGNGWVITYPNGRVVTVLDALIMGSLLRTPYPTRETIRKYYTGPTLINSPSKTGDGTLPVLPMPDPIPAPAPAPMPFPFPI